MTAWSLNDLARLQVGLSEEMCSTACRDYHAAWPVLRAARLVGGIDADRKPFLEILGPLLQNQVGRRILIAGCADSALLSLVADHAPATSHITVIDRCPTPLTVCRHVAASSLSLKTLQTDLLTHDPDGSYDVIVCHSLLPFFGDRERNILLRRFANWLSPEGALVLAVRLKQISNAEESEWRQAGEWVAARVTEARKELAGRLTSEAMGPVWSGHQDERLHGYYRFMATQNLPYSQVEDAVGEFQRAGLTVTTMLTGGEGLSFMTPDWRSKQGVPGLVLSAVRSERIPNDDQHPVPF